jgi:hypothetical protein
MALTEWMMQGTEFGHCNCDWGCPCQFNGLPSHGNCCAHTFVQIDQGRFGNVSLDGLRWGILAAWPGPIHLGHGTFQAIVDERADAKQRAALEAVALGRETDPGKLVWQIFAAMTETTLPTLAKRIELAIDLKGRTAKVSVPGIIEADAGSIRNPVTGAPHRVSVTLPEGVEFTTAEFGSGNARASSGPIKLDFTNTHAHLAPIHWSTHGVVR